MAIQIQYFPNSGNLKTLPITKHIGAKNLATLWLHDIGLNAWVHIKATDWELINNSVVLLNEYSTLDYDELQVKVADTYDELSGSPDDIEIVAGIKNEIIIVAGIAPEVVAVAGIDQEVVDVVSIKTEIIDVTTDPLRKSIIDGEANADRADNAAGRAEQAAKEAGASSVKYKEIFTATQGQTHFTSLYGTSDSEIYINGSLLSSSDYMLEPSTNSFILFMPSDLNDDVAIISFISAESKLVGIGTTANRPSSPYVGYRYFDTDIGIPIYWYGGNWIKSDGSTL